MIHEPTTAATEARLSELRARMNDWKPRCAVEGCATRAASFLLCLTHLEALPAEFRCEFERLKFTLAEDRAAAILAAATWHEERESV